MVIIMVVAMIAAMRKRGDIDGDGHGRVERGDIDGDGDGHGRAK